MACARRQPGRSWEACTEKLQALGIHCWNWPVPLTLDGCRNAPKTPPPATPAQQLTKELIAMSHQGQGAAGAAGAAGARPQQPGAPAAAGAPRIITVINGGGAAAAAAGVLNGGGAAGSGGGAGGSGSGSGARSGDEDEGEEDAVAVAGSVSIFHLSCFAFLALFGRPAGGLAGFAVLLLCCRP